MQYKASLVGHSDSISAEDTGHLQYKTSPATASSPYFIRIFQKSWFRVGRTSVTNASNYWNNINPRAPSFRFGTGHIFNSYFYAVNTGINTRMGAQLLVESSEFENSSTKATYSVDSDVVGYAVVNDIALRGSASTAATGTLTSVPYSYSKLGSGSVKSSVTANAGQKLSFCQRAVDPTYCI